MSLFLECIKYALCNSISRSGAWAPAVGAAALWLVLLIMGYGIAMPDSLPTGIALFLMCAGAAWILIFSARLLYAPYHFIKQARSERDTAKTTLTAIRAARDFDFVTMGLQLHKVGDLYQISRISLTFQNSGNIMIHYQIRKMEFVLGILPVTVPLPPGPGSGGFVVANTQGIWSGDLTPNPTVDAFPLNVIIDYEIDYDNVPPINKRTTKRTIKFVYQSFEPVVSHNTILSHEEL